MSTPSPCVDYALSFFPDAKANGRAWKARCRVHDEKTPSFQISEGRDGRALFKCFGCNAEFMQVVVALGMDLARLFPADSQRPAWNSERPLITAEYNYLDAAGEKYLQVLRYSNKEFKQRHWDGKDWVWGLGGRQTILYRLPEVLAAVQAGIPVWVAEGEKDVHTLEGLGLVATTSPGGAGKWKEWHAAPLYGARVLVLEDNDDPGRQHAEQVLRSLHGKAASLRRIALAGLPKKGDVTDWVLSQLQGGH